MRSERLATLRELFAGGLTAPQGPEASAFAALDRAGARARAQGLAVLGLGMQAVGEARELASVLAAISLQGVREGRASVPTVILSGGPVHVGGRPVGAAGFLLALALALDAHPAIFALASAGAMDEGAPAGASGWAGFVAPDTVQRARAQGLDAPSMFMAGQARRFFESVGDRVPIDEPQSGALVLRAVLLV